MKDISCLGLHYSLTEFGGELQSNFTFRFPPKTGMFFHVPILSLFAKEKSVWETQFRGSKFKLI